MEFLCIYTQSGNNECGVGATLEQAYRSLCDCLGEDNLEMSDCEFYEGTQVQVESELIIRKVPKKVK